MRLININTSYYFSLFFSIVFIAVGGYFLIKYHDSTILKVGSLSISYGSSNKGYLLYGISFTGLGLFMLISTWVYYSNLKSDLIEYFEVCPFCRGPTTAKLARNGLFGKVIIWCRDCGAKWEVKYSSISGHLKSVILKVSCKDGREDELVNKTFEPDEFIYKIRNMGNHGQG